MGRPQQRARPQRSGSTHGRPRRRGYRHAVLTDPRGRPLIYADNLVLIPSGRGGSIGVAGATFAPGVFERISRGLPTVGVYTANRRRVTLHRLRLVEHAGEQRTPEGGWHVLAAVGTYRALERV